MTKFKLYVTSLCLLGTIGAVAQTDVTSTYLANPGFEEGTDGTAAHTPKGYYKPFAWDAQNLPSSGTCNFQILSGTETAESSASAFGVNVAPAEGSYYYFGRNSWSGSLDVILSQETKAALPAGKYLLSVSYKSATKLAGTEGALSVSVAAGGNTLATGKSALSGVPTKAYVDNYFEKGEWASVAVPFTVSTEGKVTVSLGMNFNPKNVNTKQEAIIIDDVKLYNLDAVTAENPLDVSWLIFNRNFNCDTNGWTTTTGAQNSALANNKQGAFDGNFWENWKGSNYKGKMYQTLKNLPNGLYSLGLSAFVNVKGDDGTQYIYANGEKVNVAAGDPAAYTTGKVLVSDGTLEIGFEQTVENNNWAGIDNAILTYYGVPGDDLFKTDYEAILQEAKGLDKQVMSVASQNALTEALTTYGAVTSGYEAAIQALTDVVKKVKTSIHSYKVINGEATIADDALDGWTCENSQTFHINTWSTEGSTDGSNMVTPFVENWVANGSILGKGKVYYSLAGLDPGYYKASALVRVYSEAGNVVKGATFFVGDRSVDLSTGTPASVGTKKAVYGTYTLVGKVGDDGVLKFGVDITDPNFNWVALKTLKAEKGTENEYNKLPFDVALAAAKAAKDNETYKNVTGEEKTALDNAISTYEGTTTDYIAAKEALEAATKAFVEAAPAYDAYNAAKTTTDPDLKYASLAVKANFTNALGAAAPTKAVEAQAAADAITNALRAYYESNAKAEGVDGAEMVYTYDFTDKAVSGMKVGEWTVSQSGGNLGVLNGESWTDAAGNHAYGYLDYWNGDANNQHATFNRTLEAGKYMLTIKARAQKGLYTYVAAGGNETDIQEIGSTGGVFGRGWNDASVEFTTTGGEVTLEWKSVPTGGNHGGWAGFGDVRLVKLGSLDVVTLDETATVAPVVNATPVNVNVKRTLKAGWNAVCLPFAVSEEVAKQVFGASSEIAQFTNDKTEGETVTLSFTKVAAIAAGEPCLVYVPAEVANPVFTGVLISVAAPVAKNGTDYNFTGTFVQADAVTTGDVVVSGGKLCPAAQNINLKGFRSYFDATTASPAKAVNFVIDGVTTAINDVNSVVSDNAKMYRLNGIQLNNSANYKGVIIKNGKKYIK